MIKFKIAPAYSKEYVEINRPSPLTDNRIEKEIFNVLSGNIDRDISDAVYENFKKYSINWLTGSTLNSLRGLDKFERIDIINGCTQFIDSIYMNGLVQTIRNDYRYHERLGISYIREVGSLIPGIPLIIALPFPQVGNVHDSMEEILYEASIKNIDVHIDGAWISCCRDINFNFDHPQIKSVAFSLSKGLGLGWNRVGIRWLRTFKQDSISIMNDFKMNNRALSMIGLHFLKVFPSDYMWITHGNNYYKICEDFGLTPTKSIYLALDKNMPVGVSPLLRYLENDLS